MHFFTRNGKLTQKKREKRESDVSLFECTFERQIIIFGL